QRTSHQHHQHIQHRQHHQHHQQQEQRICLASRSTSSGSATFASSTRLLPHVCQPFVDSVMNRIKRLVNVDWILRKRLPILMCQLCSLASAGISLYAVFFSCTALMDTVGNMCKSFSLSITASSSRSQLPVCTHFRQLLTLSSIHFSDFNGNSLTLRINIRFCRESLCLD
ncbi:unnamed protein product, partial [Protopolystoma xenopodis]